MQPKPTVALDPQQRLDEVVTAYLKAVEVGQKPDRQQWLEANPDIAAELAEFFADEDQLVKVAGPLRVPVNQATPRPYAGRQLNVPAALPVGRFGDYELQAEIARGGMGVVYRARQISVNRVVALKMILGGSVASQADVQRFHNEAVAAAHLDHANIIPIYDVGTHDGQPFFTMKLIAGGSLAERLPCSDADRKPLIALLAKVARAVHYAHQHGILHRDLKPANILISGHTDSTGSVEIKSSASVSGIHGITPVVTDFGLAKLVERGSDITRSGAIVGTPTYMAPEQAKGQHKTISTAADVYSLGVILYEVLTGRVPFKGETPMDTVLMLLEREPTPPRQLNRRIDADLETICLKCLEKEPNRRYESAEALAEELERWLSGESIQARPTGPMTQAWKWMRRKPSQAMIAAMALIIVSLCVVGFPVSAMGWNEAKRLYAQATQAKDEAENARKHAQDQAESEKKARQAADDALHEAERARKQADEARADAVKQAEVARNALAHAELQTYYARIGQAEGQLRAHNVLRARELLDACPSKLRQWEWSYLHRLCHLELATWRPHNAGGYLWTGFSADGQRVAALWWDAIGKRAEVCVLDPKTGQAIWKHAADANWGSCAAIGPDNLIAFPTHDGGASVVEVWDTQKNRLVQTLRGHQQPVVGVAFSGDGKRLATIAAGEVKIWDATNGQVQNTRTDIQPSCVAFSPDSDLLAVGCGQRPIHVIDAVTSETKTTLTTPNYVFGLAFRPGSPTLASTGEDEIRLWNTQTGKPIATLTKQNGFIFTIAFSRDGKHMATPACDMTIRVWDAETQEELYALGGHTKPVMGVCFNAAADRLVSVGSDSSIRLWNTPNHLEATVVTDAAALRNAVLSADGKRVATSSAIGGVGAAKVWDAATGQLLQTVKNVASNAALSPDGRLLAVGMGSATVLNLGSSKMASGETLVKIFDVTTGQEVQVLKGHKALPSHVAFSPDGKRLVSLCNFADMESRTGHSEIKVWDPASGKELRSWRGAVVVAGGAALSFSHDGKRLATAGVNGQQQINVAQVWDTETGALLFTGTRHVERVEAVALSPDGRTLAEAAGVFEERPQISLYDLTTGKEATRLKGHFSHIHGLAFAPDGRRLASSSFDRTVKLWDPIKAEEVLTLHGHGGHVYSVGFCGDGQRLVSAGSDKTFRIWDATPAPAATARK